jgi:hypothetical protein
MRTVSMPHPEQQRVSENKRNKVRTPCMHDACMHDACIAYKYLVLLFWRLERAERTSTVFRVVKRRTLSVHHPERMSKNKPNKVRTNSMHAS